MVYLFVGGDASVKDRKISEIKKRNHLSSTALNFDYEVLHAAKLDSQAFKKSLWALPAVSPKRLILIRQIQKLSPHNKKILLEFIGIKQEQTIVILDSDEPLGNNKFVQQLKSHAQVEHFGEQEKANVFDVTNAISARNTSKALRILSEILSEGTAPLQIMGALVWFWGKSRNRLSKRGFEQGLKRLQEADLNIKRSRLKPESALEVLVVQLIGCFGTNTYAWR